MTNCNDIPLETFLRAVAMQAEQEFRETGGLDLTWFFHDAVADEDRMAIFPHVDPNKKMEIADMVRSLFWENHVTRYAVACEAWGSAAGVIPPASDPKRYELISIYAEDASGVIRATIDITRSADGKPTLGKLEVGELEQPNHERAGRFENLLPPPSKPNSWDPKPEIREKVEAFAQELGVDRFYMCAISTMPDEFDMSKRGPVKVMVEIYGAFRSHEEAIAAAPEALGTEDIEWTNPRRTAVYDRRAFVIQPIDIAELTKLPERVSN